MAKKRNFSTHDKLKMCELYLSGRTTTDIAKEYSVIGVTVWKILKKSGIEINAGKRISDKWNNDLKFRENQIKKRIGKTTNKGMTWTCNKVIRRPNIMGEKNPSYKNGKNKIILSVRGMPENRFWKKSVLMRDNYTCVICGRNENEITINVDHIYPLSKLIIDYNITNILDAAKCLPLWDINNGRTLCISCHRKTETHGVNLHKKTKKKI